MRLVHFVINISQKCMSLADVWKYRLQVHFTLNNNLSTSSQKQLNIAFCGWLIVWYV